MNALRVQTTRYIRTSSRESYLSKQHHHKTTMEFKSFIITFKDHVPDADVSTIKKSISALGGNIVHDYSLIKGFAVKLPSSLSIEKLRGMHGDSIATIEEDKEVKAL